MIIKLNGETQTLESPKKLSEIIFTKLNNSDPKGIAVALNEMIIPKQKWESVTVNENDEIEIVHAVQGG